MMNASRTPLRLAGLATFLALTGPVLGISLSINEDSTTCLDFNVVWGATPATPGYDIYYSHGAQTALAIDQDIYLGHDLGYVYLNGNSTILPHSSFNFTITFPSGTRFFAGATLAGLPPATQIDCEVLPLSGNAYGARVVLGQPQPVPEPACCALVTGLGALALVAFRHPVNPGRRSR